MEEIGGSTRSDTVIIDRNGDVSDINEEEEIEKIEEEVMEMGEKIKKYRSTLPAQLKSTLSSLLSSQRPPLLSLSSQHLPLPDPSSGSYSHSLPGDSSGVLPANDDGQTVDEVKLLREKISSNISAMPGVLKRMKDCISRIDKLVSSNETIHPAFKRIKRLEDLISILVAILMIIQWKGSLA